MKMNTFMNAMMTDDSRTENGAVAHSTSGSRIVDFFFMVGAARKLPDDQIFQSFSAAYAENPQLALRGLFWARDIRGGAGERRVFRSILASLLKSGKSDVVASVLKWVPFYGRWDDMFPLLGLNAGVDTVITALVEKGLKSGDGLLAKWMPRKGAVAAKLRSSLGLTPRNYRKKIVSLSKTVEQQMSAGKWDSIEYSSVPSIAMKNYGKAFGAHDPLRFKAFKDALVKGEVKINASAIFPHDVLKGKDPSIVNSQWKALPNWMEGSAVKGILPVIDVSASMDIRVPGSASTCMDVAIALGLYMAERNEGSFKDCIATFSQKPSWFNITGIDDVLVKSGIMQRDANWGGNTNLTALFDLMIDKAVREKVPQSEMPGMMIIVSDMQFDRAMTGVTPYKDAKFKFESAGYKMPKIVFWNLNSPLGKGTIPVKFRDDGTALVSGFSPSILKSILSCKDLSPQTLVEDTLNSSRYAQIKI